MDGELNPQPDKKTQVANPIVDWGLILLLPSMLAFVVIGSGGLTDWTPLIPRDWGMSAFVGFNVGYCLIWYLLVRWYGRNQNPRSHVPVSPPGPNSEAVSESNHPLTG
jgi:hypothetical protein